jgi:hypothetical protein
MVIEQEPLSKGSPEKAKQPIGFWGIAGVNYVEASAA